MDVDSPISLPSDNATSIASCHGDGEIALGEGEIRPKLKVPESNSLRNILNDFDYSAPNDLSGSFGFNDSVCIAP